jgi:hypothetical protein
MVYLVDLVYSVCVAEGEKSATESVCLVGLVYLVYLVGRTGKPTSAPKKPHKPDKPDEQDRFVEALRTFPAP